MNAERLILVRNFVEKTCGFSAVDSVRFVVDVFNLKQISQGDTMYFELWNPTTKEWFCRTPNHFISKYNQYDRDIYESLGWKTRGCL